MLTIKSCFTAGYISMVYVGLVIRNISRSFLQCSINVRNTEEPVNGKHRSKGLVKGHFPGMTGKICSISVALKPALLNVAAEMKTKEND